MACLGPCLLYLYYLVIRIPGLKQGTLSPIRIMQA